jgi:hypothetical protein
MSAGIIEQVARDSGAVLSPLTVQQYEAMMEAGILQEGAPIELIDGLLVHKDRRDGGSPGKTIGTLHAHGVVQFTNALAALLQGSHFHVRSQQPVTLSEIDQPEPDVLVAKGTAKDYRAHHPGPTEISLVIEVADSSLTYDRTTKQRLYAVAGIPAYWIVDLTQSRIEVYERPNPQQERYESAVGYGIGDVVTFTIGSQALGLRVGEVL